MNQSKVVTVKYKKVNCIDTCISVLYCRMQKAGIPCPTVAMLKKHILVMSFIGKDQKPAPKLKDAVLSSRQLRQAYQQCVEVRLIWKWNNDECQVVRQRSGKERYPPFSLRQLLEKKEFSSCLWQWSTTFYRSLPRRRKLLCHPSE